MCATVIDAETLADARAFAESVAGALGRHGRGTAPWVAGEPVPVTADAAVADALDALGFAELAEDPSLMVCAGHAGIALGTRLADLALLDGLLGGAPLVGELVRCRVTPGRIVALDAGRAAYRALRDSEPRPSADGLAVHRVLELGDPVPVDDARWGTALGAWTAASVGYLAGLGEAALALTVQYARERSAFDSTLAALDPVQQILAAAATEVQGVRLLAERAPSVAALAHAGPAVAEACARCHQVTGAIGYTLEYPLHRHTQRARALAVWNDALIDALAIG